MHVTSSVFYQSVRRDFLNNRVARFLVEETRLPGENHIFAANALQTFHILLYRVSLETCSKLNHNLICDRH